MDRDQAPPGHVPRRSEHRLTTSPSAPSAPSTRREHAGLDDHVGFLLRLAYQRAAANLTEAIGETGLTPTQLAALMRLDERGALSQNQLGRSVGMAPANIHASVRDLAAAGLVKTGPDATDQRLLVVELTDGGRDVLRRAGTGAATANSRTLSALSPHERRTLMTLLRRLVTPAPARPERTRPSARASRRRSRPSP